MIRDGRMKHPLYSTWMNMKQRCINPNNPKYERYGKRDINICLDWLDFWNFVRDMGERPVGMTLDRIDVNGNYEPSNCRWADKFTQIRNSSRTFTGHVINIQKYRKMTVLSKPWRAEIQILGDRRVCYFKTEQAARNWLGENVL